ncbi:UvrD-helicase domain-containing protein [bacterium]|jgi:DNA helicase II / ATP-dependent DNA helicase PcrA|nr:UvrD-helicase domain-containing protein [bacterium]MBT6831997.1 UvrD-helicase domain-containing protein [bacterium]MBT6996797.1 UvrD-helicase domain-containing protein [bacterium]MBT7772078.1 UvrD-helicase domain-containing protein [bacterium]
MEEKIFAGLNPNQVAAVKVLAGPVLILAGAGSGKTKTLTHRIAHLIANGATPREILAVTFTNKAAKEMGGRIEKLLGPGNQPHVGTFHATCVRILRDDVEKLENGLTKNFVIFDSDDAKNLVKIILKDFGFDEKEVKHRAVAGMISSLKNQLETPISFRENVPRGKTPEAVARVFPEYQKRLVAHNALDFDDLLQKTVELFESAPDVLKKYRNRWNHLLVDEYQDTNFAQYRIVRLLSDEHKNLCVIGDDHQSIYKFRGADFTNILNFEKDFPKAAVIKLEQNYRSTGNILKNANALISFNETGRAKKLWTENESGEKLKIAEVWNEREEGNFIAEKIREKFDDGEKFGDCAILYRMNAQSRAIEEALMRRQIPYQIVGGTRFFDRKEIKDVVGYLRLIFNPRDDLSFLRVVNVPTRKLGKATIDTVKNFAKNYSVSMFEVLENSDELPLPDAKKEVLKNFHDLILNLRKIAASEPISILLDRLIEKTKFLKSLDDGSAEGESRQENVRELFSVAGRYDAAENPLAAFLEGVALISDLDQMENSDSVTLMTIHASKGLEFPHVFLPGWEDGIFPGHSSQFSFDDLEEERRLGYVAITRSEKTCTILHARQRMMFGQTQQNPSSKFLEELCAESCDRERSQKPGKSFEPKSREALEPFSDEVADFSQIAAVNQKPKSRSEAIWGISENETNLKIADRIRHANFGEGTVIQVDGDVLSVAFAGIGVKKIVASVAPIEKI